MKQMQSWWRGLSLRDRRLLVGWFVVIGLTVLFWACSLLVNLQERARAQLAVEHRILGDMHAQAEEMQQLKQLPTAGGGIQRVPAIAAAEYLPKFGLSPAIVQTQSSDDQVNLQGSVAFDKWVEWLAVVQKDMRMIVQTAKITRSDRTGVVDIQAVLELQKE